MEKLEDFARATGVVENTHRCVSCGHIFRGNVNEGKKDCPLCKSPTTSLINAEGINEPNQT